MSRKSSVESAVTLRDEDIGSERVVNRRSLLGVLGAGVAAGAILGTTATAHADDSDSGEEKKAEKPEKPEKPKPPMEETDTD